MSDPYVTSVAQDLGHYLPIVEGHLARQAKAAEAQAKAQLAQAALASGEPALRRRGLQLLSDAMAELSGQE